MEPKKSGRWTPLLILAGVLGGGVVLFILFLVVPAVLFLSAGESELRIHESNGFFDPPHSEVSVPDSDGSQAPDFFDDLEQR